ncbi:MAG: hypothetical protein LBP68_00890, partial [Acidobacteriota bacterium]|nr:hypothetical protein [Acidobacteriota bacterium]
AVIVRLDKDAIEPNDFARLNLTVPAHTESFAGYAVEFKLREGDTVPYKDLRDEYKALHSRPQQPSNP